MSIALSEFYLRAHRHFLHCRVCMTAALDTALREYMNFNTTRETLGIDKEWEGEPIPLTS